MFFDRWTISKRLYAGCGTFVTLTALASAVAVIGTSRIKGDVDMLSRRAATLQHALTIQATLFKIESQEKGMLWAGLDADRAQYAKSKAGVAAEYERATNELDGLAATADDADRSVARTLTDNVRQSKLVHEELNVLGDAAKFSEAQQLINDKQTPVLKAAEEVAAGLVTRHQAVMGQTRGEAATSYLIVEIIIGIVAVLALVGSIVGVWIVHGINRSLRAVSSELREGSQLVVNASSQMAVVGAVGIAGRLAAGGVPRGNVRLDGGDGGHDAPERRQLARGRQRRGEPRRKSSPRPTRRSPRWSTR